MGKYAELIKEAGGEVAKIYLKTGEPDAEVVALAEEIGADLIVAGSRGKSPLRRPIGSVSSSIVGCRLLRSPERFYVKGEEGPLEPGEEYWAKAWALHALGRPESAIRSGR